MRDSQGFMRFKGDVDMPQTDRDQKNDPQTTDLYVIDEKTSYFEI